jgi:tRNA (guanine-N7-)-methyltransferase
VTAARTPAEIPATEVRPAPAQGAPVRPRRTVKSFHVRAGRMTRSQERALERLWPVYGLEVDGSRLDLEALFGRRAPVALEIGCGMGEATAEMAAAQPDRDLLTVDVHPPGLGSLLRRVEDAGVTHVRVAQGDALDLIGDMLPPESLAEVRLFFPDPWPKKRHHKRRIVTPEFCDLVAGRLQPGGLLHVATDWAPYAEVVDEVLDAHPAFTTGGTVPWRPETRFERQGREAGRPSRDIVARRR